MMNITLLEVTHVLTPDRLGWGAERGGVDRLPLAPGGQNEGSPPASLTANFHQETQLRLLQNSNVSRAIQPERDQGLIMIVS